MVQNDSENSLRPFWYTSIAGLCAFFIGLGLCRFAYPPLVPDLINQAWVSKAGAGYLGSINFIGYLLGAYLGQHIGKYVNAGIFIKLTLLVSVIGLGLCAIHWNFIWFAAWRFLVGISGALLVVLTPSLILKHVPIRFRGKAAGLIFTGVGLGIIISGFIFPPIAKVSLSGAWLTIALFAGVAVLISWSAFSSVNHINSKSDKSAAPSNHPIVKQRRILILLSFAYGLYGIATVPPTLFLVDYIHLELGLSPVASGLFWALFGFGALLGPFTIGTIADRTSTHKCLVATYVISCIAIAMVLFNQIIILYVVSSVLMGFTVTSIAVLISSRIMELVGTIPHPKFWGKMTVYLGISQSLGAYGMSLLLHKGIDYSVCFVIAEITFLIGLVIVIFTKPQEVK